MRALILALFMPLAAHAECAMYSWSVFPPPGSKVPANGRFVVEGYGSAQTAVTTLSSRKPRLVPVDGAPIPLDVVEINSGEFELTQAVLVPKSPLKEDTRYTLEFDTDVRTPFFIGPGERASWVISKPDLEPPRWTSAPQALPGEIVQFGCGPSVEARVSVGVEDASPLQLRVKVTRANGRAAQYLVPRTRPGPLRIGHGMCSGAFSFHDEAWSLELFAVDAAGNTAPAPSTALRFRGVNPR